MSKVKIGMIGAGGMANAVHYPSLSEMEDVEIAAISDLNEQRLTETADKYDVGKRYADYKKMLAETDLDCVYVIMPPHHLFDIVVTCLNEGMPVCIEKPPAVTTFQIEQLANLATKKDLQTMVLFNRRHIPLMNRVRAMVEERGPIIQCSATFLKHHIGGGPYYNGAIDILRCDAIHAVDTLCWMGGDVRKVASCVNSFYMDFGNSFNALVEFESGAVGFLSTNWAVGTRVHTFEMHAKGISAFLNPDEDAVIYADGAKEGTRITAVEAAGGRTEFYHSYGFFAENRHFIDCLKNKTQPNPSFVDAVKSMALADRIYANTL